MRRWGWSSRVWTLVLAAAACTAGCSADDLEGDGDPETFDGLTAPVEIVLDDRGIPHVYAQTDSDLFYAAGYQMATDRLFQMDLMRRRALGRRAEVLGPGLAEGDEISRIFDFQRWGRENAERMLEQEPEFYALFSAWTAGVNKRVEEVRDGSVPLPYGFGPAEADYQPEPWAVEDGFTIAKLLFFGNSNSLERELLATIVQRSFPEAWSEIELCRPAFGVPTMPESELPAARNRGPGFQGALAAPPIDATPEQLRAAVAKLRRAMQAVPRTGSNNWAVAGEHTDNGRPLVAGDPHQPLESPSLMYTQHLNSVDGKGRFDVAGWAFSGAPGVHLGHNRHVHWTATTNFADVMDIWEVQFDGARVKIGDDWVDVEFREEVVEIAGEGPRTLTMRDVPGHGVLLPDDLLPIAVAGSGEALLLNWTGFRATDEEPAFFNMALATNVDEYDAAVDLQQVGAFNFVAADAESITYRVSSLVPDRGDPSARQMPYIVLDGNDASSYWTEEFLPREQMPHSRGGERGWIGTANNDPWGFTFDGDVSNDPWYYGYFYAAGHRASRIQTELETLVGRGDVTVEDMQIMQTDTKSALAGVLVPLLGEAWAASSQAADLEPFADDPELATLVELLTQTWDQRMQRDSAGAVVFHVWLMLLTEEVVKDELSLLYTTILGEESPFVVKFPMLALTGQYPNSAGLLDNLQTAQTRDYVLLRALGRTRDALVERFGTMAPDAYVWGDIHGTDFRNPFGGDLAGGWVPTDGGEDTINVSASQFVDDDGAMRERFDSHQGAIFRVVTTFEEDGTPKAFANFPPGNSGDPNSEHFKDTLSDWVDGDYQPIPFRRQEVDAAARSTLMLEPADHPATPG